MDRKFLDFLQNRSPRSRRVPLIVRGGQGRWVKVIRSASMAQRPLSTWLRLTWSLIPLTKTVLNRWIQRASAEIQDCPAAILALRAFKEQRPGLDVIAAGSLLEFALDDTTIRSFPVGRVSFAWMHP